MPDRSSSTVSTPGISAARHSVSCGASPVCLPVEPFASLDPRQTLFAIIEEPLKNFERLSAATSPACGALPPRWPPPSCCRVRRGSFPAASASGWRLAPILEPAILVLDEATSALDVTVQAQILALRCSSYSSSWVRATCSLPTIWRRSGGSPTASRCCAPAVVEHGDVNRLFAAPQQALHPRTDRRHSRVSSRLAQPTRRA